jgi:hypothetical protein
LAMMLAGPRIGPGVMGPGVMGPGVMGPGVMGPGVMGPGCRWTRISRRMVRLGRASLRAVLGETPCTSRPSGLGQLVQGRDGAGAQRAHAPRAAGADRARSPVQDRQDWNRAARRRGRWQRCCAGRWDAAGWPDPSRPVARHAEARNEAMHPETVVVRASGAGRARWLGRRGGVGAMARTAVTPLATWDGGGRWELASVVRGGWVDRWGWCNGENRGDTPCNVGRWWWVGVGASGAGWLGRRAGLVRLPPRPEPWSALRGPSLKGGGRTAVRPLATWDGGGGCALTLAAPRLDPWNESGSRLSPAKSGRGEFFTPCQARAESVQADGRSAVTRPWAP